MTLCLWQITEASHPYETNPLTIEEKLKRECVYYLYVLLKSHQQLEGDCDDGDSGDGNGGDGDGDCDVMGKGLCRVALKDLLLFPRVKELCSSVDDIRLLRMS